MDQETSASVVPGRWARKTTTLPVSTVTVSGFTGEECEGRATYRVATETRAGSARLCAVTYQVPSVCGAV